MKSRVSLPRHIRPRCCSTRPGLSREAVSVQHATTSNGSRVQLDDVRGALLRQEDSIIFALIERAHFARNEAVYECGGVPVPAYTAEGRCFTFLEYFVRDTDDTHGRIRRYTSPDEHAFFPEAMPPMVRRYRHLLLQVQNLFRRGNRARGHSAGVLQYTKFMFAGILC